MLDRPFAPSVPTKDPLPDFFSKESYGRHSGVFSSFAYARASLPPGPEFDREALAEEYVDVRAKKVFAYDYPVMWWLNAAFAKGAASVLDIGGSVGVHYYAYQGYFDMPEALTWRVVEVSTMVSIGQELAVKNGAHALTFEEDLEPVIASTAHDVWISAGAIQFLDDARPDELLKRCIVRPKHILLNKLPLYHGEDFVTTQNIGHGSFAPLHVYNRARLIRDIRLLGYTLRDWWAVHERSMDIPGHPERSFPTFSGLYFVDNATLGASQRT
ncbi:MAG: methyltransferase, TIGR04325 family [Variovorax sp.]